MERDILKKILEIQNVNDDILLPAELEKATRRIKHQDMGYETISLGNILQHLDLGDKLSLLMRQKKYFSHDYSSYISRKEKIISLSIPIRNAVMHGRPLTIEEYAQGFSLATNLSKSPQYWPNLSRSLRKYNEDPESIRSRSIEILDSEDWEETLNNLPIPDYDDTGFLPRGKLEDELKRKILSRNPVVTVLGDGGNGKTALALQTLYGMLNNNDHGFDAIVWVSAKSSTLTVSEIKRIENAITKSSGIFDNVLGLFDEKNSDPLSRVRYLLGSNKILLAIDNLETVLDQSIRDFVSDIPGESKVLFTSRIPIGSDVTVSVGEFSEAESIVYIRRVIEAYSIQSLKKCSNDDLKRFIKALGGKPLLIKWFSLSVLSGLNPYKVILDPRTALRFCLENVFDSLGEEAKTVLSVMAQLPRPVSLEVLRFVSEEDIVILERGVSELLMYTIIHAKDISSENNYELKPFARSYITKILNLKPMDVEGIIRRFRSLEGTLQEELGANNQNKYDIKRYKVENVSEALCVKTLKHAVSQAFKKDYESAFNAIESAKISNPGYFEVYRTEAFINFEATNYSAAKDCYERAIDIAPTIPQLRFFFSGFLIRSYKDYDGAVEQLEEALNLDSKSNEIKLEIARIKMFQFKFTEALEFIEKINLPENLFNKFYTKVKDVEFNIHKRNLEYLSSRGGSNFEISNALQKWADFHASLDPRSIDEKFYENLNQILGKLHSLYSKYSEDETEKLFSALRDNVERFKERQFDMSPLKQSASPLIGQLKINGLRPDFGFLIFNGSQEIFIHSSVCDEQCWEALRSGAKCYFTTGVDSFGRTRVNSVRLIESI